MLSRLQPSCLGTHDWSLVTALSLPLGRASSFLQTGDHPGQVKRQPAGPLWHFLPFGLSPGWDPTGCILSCLIWEQYGHLVPPGEWFVLIVCILLMVIAWLVCGLFTNPSIFC